MAPDDWKSGHEASVKTSGTGDGIDCPFFSIGGLDRLGSVSDLSSYITRVICRQLTFLDTCVMGVVIKSTLPFVRLSR